jgi:hypothetical protein
VDLGASAAINDAPSAFPNFAIFRVTRTSFQREGTSFSRAAASFQRHVKGMAITAPAAARKCATGCPSMPATCPHTALPTVIAPKKNGQEYCESTRAQPVKAIWGRIKAHDDKRPRSSRDETCAESDYGLAREPQ